MLTKENLQGFITESPFSFKNPIFFSVPHNPSTKRKIDLKSKRQLFPIAENAIDFNAQGKKKVQQ
jgi:hypothetical protein